MKNSPDFSETLAELDAGLLLSKLSQSLGTVALGVINHHKKGKVVLTLELEQIGETSQINLNHKISYIKPTLRGKSMEEDTTSTPVYANKNGHLTVSPETQFDMYSTQQEKA